MLMRLARMKFCHGILETLGYHTVKTRTHCLKTDGQTELS